jgi:hypothetical protein
MKLLKGLLNMRSVDYKDQREWFITLLDYAKSVDPKAEIYEDHIIVKIKGFNIRLEASNHKFIVSHINKLKSVLVFFKLKDLKNYIKGLIKNG